MPLGWCGRSQRCPDPGPGAQARLALVLLPRGWTKRQGLKMCLMCKAPKVPQTSPTALCKQDITGISVFMLMSGPGLIHSSFNFGMSGLSEI